MRDLDFRWMLVIPPLGMARTQGLAVVQAFRQELSDGVSIFDCQEVLHKIHSSVRSEEDVEVLDWMNQNLLVRALEQKISHLLCLSSAPVDPHYLQLLQAQGIKTIHWLYEDARIADYWIAVLTGYNFFCSSQHGNVERVCVEQGTNYYWLPLGAVESPKATLSLWHSRPLDLVFVGACSPYRVQVLERLATAGLVLGICGEGWGDHKGLLQHSVIQTENVMVDVLQKARIVVQLSQGKPDDSATEVPLPPSLWDAIAAGAFPMVEKSPANGQNLAGVVFQEFSNSAELLALCIAMRQNGIDQTLIEENQRAILQSHTLNHRIRRIFEIVDFS